MSHRAWFIGIVLSSLFSETEIDGGPPLTERIGMREVVVTSTLPMTAPEHSWLITKLESTVLPVETSAVEIHLTENGTVKGLWYVEVIIFDYQRHVLVAGDPAMHIGRDVAFEEAVASLTEKLTALIPRSARKF